MEAADEEPEEAPDTLVRNVRIMFVKLLHAAYNTQIEVHDDFLRLAWILSSDLVLLSLAIIGILLIVTGIMLGTDNSWNAALFICIIYGPQSCTKVCNTKDERTTAMDNNRNSTENG